MNMDKGKTAYCRLCAELKPCNKLKTYELGDQLNQDIINKLARVNAVADFSLIHLPKTVCFVCINNLDRTYDFVTSVEKAQGILTNLLPVSNIKEEHNSEYDSPSYEPFDVKYEENLIVKEETLEESTSKPRRQKAKSIDNKSKKSKITTNSLDIIPLSQLKLTWRDYSWECALCETQFPNIDELKEHSMQFHHSCNSYRCSDCNIRKYCLNSFLIHVRRHKTYLRLSCYKCFTKFRSSHEMRLHLNKYKTSRFSCLGCNGNFDNHEELEQHKNEYCRDKRCREIPKLSNNLTCLVCEKNFKTKTSLNTHLLIHTDRKRNHVCEICGKSFLHKQNLLSHKVIHDDTRPYKCEICKRSFKTKPQLRKHVGTHDGHKPFACEQCGRCFRLQRQLQSHSIIHTDSLPHICPYCNKGFRFKTILNQHLRQHTGVKPYSCSICKRDFTNWPNYNKHMKRRHGTDMAKKKHTPEGLYPIDSKTGQVIYPEMDKLQEWKKSMLQLRRPGRPKVTRHNTEVKDPQ